MAAIGRFLAPVIGITIPGDEDCCPSPSTPFKVKEPGRVESARYVGIMLAQRLTPSEIPGFRYEQIRGIGHDERRHHAPNRGISLAG